ncbi:MAG TPA: class I SAM-dependent methyltransferase [Cytophagales bacterium]|nr:class I SAM-dependent methyltransferase [Cytophagales bacterium]
METATKEVKDVAVTYEKEYHAVRHSTHFNEDYYNSRARIALKKFFKDIPKDTKLLDYGVGMGQNIYYMTNATGYDISQYGLDFCRSKGINVTNDLDALPNEGYDVVFSSHVLEHHPNPKEMVENMRSKLKTGKRLFLVIPYERHGKSDFKLDLNQHLYMWNFRNINNLLLTSGFEINENKYLRGAGYEKLLFLAKINFGLYRFCTNLVSRIFGIKEIMVIATKK